MIRKPLSARGWARLSIILACVSIVLAVTSLVGVIFF